MMRKRDAGKYSGFRSLRAERNREGRERKKEERGGRQRQRQKVMTIHLLVICIFLALVAEI